MSKMVMVPLAVLQDAFANLGALAVSVPAPTWGLIEHNLKRIQEGVKEMPSPSLPETAPASPETTDVSAS